MRIAASKWTVSGPFGNGSIGPSRDHANATIN